MPAQESKMIQRTCNMLARALEGEGNERAFIVSFSSEDPDKCWRGVEIMDHGPGAADLERLKSMGVVLFNHERNRVLGKVRRAWIEDSRGCAEIEFDTDADAEVIFQKVKSETLKGISVCARVSVWEDVNAGEKSTDGRFDGPCSIARKWEALEISIATIPADATVGVNRTLEDGNENSVTRSYCDRVIQILQLQGGNAQ